jgi:hypothetical protein
MRFTKDFNLSVRCVRCGAKLDCVLEDGAEKYDFVVVVDQHNCKAVEQSAHPTGLESPLKTVSMAYYRFPKKSNPIDPPCG